MLASQDTRQQGKVAASKTQHTRLLDPTWCLHLKVSDSYKRRRWNEGKCEGKGGSGINDGGDKRERGGER